MIKAGDEILIKLKPLKDQIRRDFKVNDFWLFGSFVRGEQKSGSDIDFLVDFKKGATLLDLTALGFYLEETLGRKVDIVSRRAIHPKLKDRILNETVNV